MLGFFMKLVIIQQILSPFSYGFQDPTAAGVTPDGTTEGIIILVVFTVSSIISICNYLSLINLILIDPQGSQPGPSHSDSSEGKAIRGVVGASPRGPLMSINYGLAFIFSFGIGGVLVLLPIITLFPFIS